MTGGVTDDAPREAPANYDVKGGTTFATATTEGGVSGGGQGGGGRGDHCSDRDNKGNEGQRQLGGSGGSTVVRVVSMEVECAPPGNARGGRDDGGGYGPIVLQR